MWSSWAWLSSIRSTAPGAPPRSNTATDGSISSELSSPTTRSELPEGYLPTSAPMSATARPRRRSVSRNGVTRVMGSVLALDHEVGTADGSGQLGLLSSELEAGGELVGDLHAVGELE